MNKCQKKPGVQIPQSGLGKDEWSAKEAKEDVLHIIKIPDKMEVPRHS